MSETRKVVLASGNKGKVAELNHLLQGLGLHIIPQSELGVPEVEETGLSFVENAILKARNAATHTGLPAIADDSGLEVDALRGAPGIYSARYAGAEASDRQNWQKLLQELEGLLGARRSARFQCLLVYMEHDKDPTPIICQGSWEGEITEQPAGENGFGYDPVFYVAEHQCTAAQLSREQKSLISHRGRALRQLQTALDALKK